MALKNKKPIQFNDFTGGWVTSKAPSNLAKNESPDLLNVKLEEEGSFSIRKGFTYFGRESFSLEFDGSSSKVEIPNDDKLNTNNDIQNRTIVLFFKANNKSNQQVLYEQGDDSKGFNIYIEGGNLKARAWSEGDAGYSGDTVESPINTDEWYLAALTWDKGVIKLYKDASQVDSVDSSSTTKQIEAHPGDIGIGFQRTSSKYHDGDDTSGDNHYFNGKIDNARVYNRTLSQSELQSIYDARDHGVDSSNLAAEWNMNLGEGTTIRDTSGNGINGTASNITWAEGYWGDGNSHRRTTSGEIIRAHTFNRPIASDKIVVRQRVDSSGNHYLEYFNTDINDWHNLEVDGSTSLSSKLGFVNFTSSTDTIDYMYFCDGNIPLERWTGAHTQTATKVSSGDSTIKVDDVSGFESSGNVMINGTDVSYTGTTSNANSADELTGCSNTPKAENNTVVTQKAKDFSANKGTKPKGNIMTVWRGQLAVSEGQFVKVSQVDDFTKWSGGVADTKGFQNGNIRGLEPRSNRLIIFLEDDIFSITYKFTSDLTGHQIQVQDIEHSEQYGAANFNSITGAEGRVAYISADNAIRFVTNKEDIFDTGNISRNIYKNGLENYDTSNASSIFFRDKFYFAVSSPDSNINDTVLVYDLNLAKNTKDGEAWTKWRMYVNDFFVRDDQLHFASSAEPNCFRMFDDADGNELRTDDGAPIKWRYKLPHLDFGVPHRKQAVKNMFARGFISSTSEVDFELFSNFGLISSSLLKLYGDNSKNTDSPVLSPSTSSVGEGVIGEGDGQDNFDFSSGYPFNFKDDFGRVNSLFSQLSISGNTAGEQFKLSRLVLEVGFHNPELTN